MMHSCDGDGLVQWQFGEAWSRRRHGGRADRLGIVAAVRGATQGEEDVVARPAVDRSGLRGANPAPSCPHRGGRGGPASAWAVLFSGRGDDDVR
jgi:hypothetical protein